MFDLFDMIREKGFNMISKELLSEVLGHDDICNERIIQNKLLYMCKNDGMIDYEYEYNIYELAHKCKEWAYKQKRVNMFIIETDIENFEINVSILYGEQHPNLNMDIQIVLIYLKKLLH